VIVKNDNNDDDYKMVVLLNDNVNSGDNVNGCRVGTDDSVMMMKMIVITTYHACSTWSSFSSSDFYGRSGQLSSGLCSFHFCKKKQKKHEILISLSFFLDYWQIHNELTDPTSYIDGRRILGAKIVLWVFLRV